MRDMKPCIIKKYYESPRNPNINQTVYLKEMIGGEYIRGTWVENEHEAYIFQTKSHAKSICKLMKLDGLSIIEK